MLFRALARRRHARRLAAVTLDAARARAARGAAILDAEDPGWANRVDAESLRLGDGQACVLGQLHGEYRRGLGRARVLDLSSAPSRFVSPVDLGFQAVGDLGKAAEDLDYALLTRAWRDIVRARRAPTAVPTPDARPEAVR
ncbi:MAG: hypothetical protein AAF845_13205 [Bacteroidota bacterium]